MLKVYSIKLRFVPLQRIVIFSWIVQSLKNGSFKDMDFKKIDSVNEPED